MISILKYGSGNINAIKNIYERLNIPCEFAETAEQVAKAEKMILPGVGAFDETIGLLRSATWFELLQKKALEDKIPILGICVGMQILGNTSEEGKDAGLCWIPGEVKLFDKKTILNKTKLPHLGWNSIKIEKKVSLLNNINEEIGFYFVHSYYFTCANRDNVIASTEYGGVFHSAINKDNIYGVQFHPEKSHDNGIQLLKNFAEL